LSTDNGLLSNELIVKKTIFLLIISINL
jgi:hypothetical protein